MSNLEDITTELAVSYKQWKDGEKLKNTWKDKFFEAVTKEAKESPAEKYVTITAPDESVARERLQKQNPAWMVDEIRPISAGSDTYEAVLVENPAYAAFTYVNRDLGMIFQKQVSAGSIYVDDERLQEENPQLWHKVTVIPNADVIRNVIYECGGDVDQFEGLWYTYQGPRELKDLSTLDADTLAALSEYIYQGKPTVKLAAPRKAKDEELG